MNKFAKKLTKEQKENRRRILEISYRKGLSHLGSCLSAVDIIASVYQVKKETEKFVLSSGHAAVAWYVVLERHNFVDQKKIDTFSIHPDRDPAIDIHVSTGSLGQGLPIAVGMALANRAKNVYCLISDGEAAEGSIWEALRIAGENRLDNLKIIVNANGFGAYGKIELGSLLNRFRAFGTKVFITNGHNTKSLIKKLKRKVKGVPTIIFAKTTVEQLTTLKGQHAHYKVLNDEEFLLGMDELR